VNAEQLEQHDRFERPWACRIAVVDRLALENSITIGAVSKSIEQKSAVIAGSRERSFKHDLNQLNH